MSFISSPKDKKKLEGFIQEISNAMLRMDSERELIKDICNRAKDELEVKPKTIRQIAKIHYKNSLVEEQMEAEELFDLYEQVFSSSSSTPTEDNDTTSSID